MQLADEGKAEEEYLRQVFPAAILAAMRGECRVLSVAEWLERASDGTSRG